MDYARIRLAPKVYRHVPVLCIEGALYDRQLARGHAHEDESNSSLRNPRFASSMDASTREGHILGCLGEAAVALALALPEPLHHERFRGQGADVGHNIEVRATRGHPFLKVVQGDPDHYNVVTVKVQLNTSSAHVWLVGYESAGVVRTLVERTDPGDRGAPAWFLPWKDTRDVRELLPTPPPTGLLAGL